MCMTVCALQLYCVCVCASFDLCVTILKCMYAVPHSILLSLGAHAQQELMVVVLCVCVCVCVCVCCLLLEYLLYRCVLAEGKCLFSNKIVFSWILIRGFR